MAKTKVILGCSIECEDRAIEVENLRFRLSHPRIYFISKKELGEETLSQKKIYQILVKRNHVKNLIKDILRHESVIEPLIVQEKNYEVLEGNSRLAACKYILEKYTSKEYDRVRKNIKKLNCIVLAKNTSESHLFSLLAQYHLRGKRAWDPYEKADYALRRFDQISMHESEEDSYKQVSLEIGMDIDDIIILCNNIKMMKKYREKNIKKYSYYNVINEDKIIKSKLMEHPDNERVLIEALQEYKNPALDFRAKIKHVCRNKIASRRFFLEKRSLEESVIK